MSKRNLGIFVRCPRVGQVKTRLSPELTPVAACALYVAFLSDLFRRLERSSKYSMTAFYTGGEPEELNAVLPGRVRRSPQSDGDLGGRLESAFRHLASRSGGSPAVIIGSDSPDIPVSLIRQAFVKLKHRDVVLGPASDGGYYLIGLKRVIPELFSDIPWGGPNVFRETLARVEAARLKLATLPLWYDVDNPESLRLLRAQVAARRYERRDRLRAVEAALERIDSGKD